MTLETKIKDGVLFVGDLHLSTRELRTTRGFVQTSRDMLDNLYTYIKDNPAINLVIFLGDIQHRTPSGKNTLLETTYWKDKLREIGELMLSRGAKVKVQMRQKGLKYDELLAEGKVYPLFTLKGNHDEDGDVGYTFYDECINEGLLVNPLILLKGYTQYNFHNYRESGLELPKIKGVKRVVGLYHDTIPVENGMSWMNFDAKLKKLNVAKIMSRVDLAVVGHIHMMIPPEYVEYSDEQIRTYQPHNPRPLIWYVGSMGRTATDKGQIRDYGWCGLVDNNTISDYGSVEIPLMSAEDYFDLNRALREKTRRKDFKDFRLDNGDVLQEESQTPIELVNEYVEDEDIRKLCVDLLEEVMEKEVIER